MVRFSSFVTARFVCVTKAPAGPVPVGVTFMLSRSLFDPGGTPLWAEIVRHHGAEGAGKIAAA